MQLCGPALPGFLFTLAATALLAVVSFSVPWFKSVYFLRAAINQSGVNGSVTFGVLGYCLDFNNQIQCSNASVGWDFDPNALLGNDLPVQIPNVVVKWITYALVLHIVALGLSGVSAVFGLLAQVRTTTMSCFSSCIAGTAAAVALIAFIFDLVLFFATRARINNVQGGSASIGNALWMTLAAWALLFFSGCAYAFGRCCASKAPSGSWGKSRSNSSRRSRKDSERTEDSGKFDRESEQLRLDAVKAEADRKARQKAGKQEAGLPAFYEYESTPLRREEPQYYEEEVEVVVPYSDRSGRGPSRASERTQVSGAAAASYRSNRNYEPGAPGTRAIDDYYNNTAPTASSLAAANTYPPQPQPSQAQRQPSYGQPHRQASSHSTSYDPYTQTQQNVPPVPTVPQQYHSPPNRPLDPYASVPTAQSQSRVDPYLAIAAATGGAAAATAYANNRGYSTDSYNQPSSHQPYPPASQQHNQSQGQQDPYAGSSYNPHAAVMSPPQPTHYLDNANSGYGTQQQGYDAYGQQQQRDPYAQQQHHDPYAQDPYVQQQYDAYGQQQGYDSYGQQQPGYDSYQEQAYSSVVPVAQPQPIPAMMPHPQVQEPEFEPRTMVASPQRGLVASPSPMASPSYSPQPPSHNVNTAVAGSSAQGHQHNWSVGESPSDAPPPQYEAMPGASGYPVEKR